MGALCAMLLDGTVRLECAAPEEEEEDYDDSSINNSNSNDDDGFEESGRKDRETPALPCAQLLGAFRGHVAAYCLGPAPCLSRSVIPRFVTSVAYGDDAVPRATLGSLTALRGRVSDALRDVRLRSLRHFKRPALGRRHALAALRGVVASISDTVKLGGEYLLCVVYVLPYIMLL